VQLERYDDFDAFVERIQDAELDCIPGAVEFADWRIGQSALGQLHLQFGFEGGASICKGAIQPDGVALFLPLINAVAQTVNGIPLDEDSIAVLEGEFCIGSRKTYEWCSLFIPRDQLAKRMEGKRELRLDDNRSVGQPVFSVRRDTRRIQLLMREVIKAARRSPQVISSPTASRVLVDDLMASVVELLYPANARHRGHSVGRPRRSRKQIVTAANERLDAVDLVPISVADLAAAVGVSERTLRTAFLEYYGVGPTRYQRDRRLHRVRRELLATSAGETTVTEILSRFGIWQHGRFAGEYRQRYGESPSETLARLTPT
jgi:AraC family transcriptional regulator, ethanolamine operon transcriptional activator